jgi:aquaporin Z
MNKYLAELLGTFVLVGIGSMAILNSGSVVGISFGFGLALMAGIYMFGAISGAHFNPAVTIAMMLKGETSRADTGGYIVAQVAGAVLASGLVAYAAGTAAVGTTVSSSAAGLEPVEILLLEAILTAIFVMVILRSTSGEGKSAPIAIPMALVAIHLAATGITGASVNPARSLGPAIIASDMADIWVWIVGPIIGAAVGFYLDKFLNSDS